MRQECEKFRTAYERGQGMAKSHRYLSGPIGSGKTHIVQSMPELLHGVAGNDQTIKGVFIYASHVKFDWLTGEWRKKTEFKVEIRFHYAEGSKQPVSGWLKPEDAWKDMGAIDESLKVLAASDLSDPSRWPKLVRLLGTIDFDRIVLIVDDYDRLQENELKEVHDALNECMSHAHNGQNPSGRELLFWLTGEIPTIRLRLDAKRKTQGTSEKIWADIEPVVCRLVSEGETDSIAKELGWEESEQTIHETTAGYPILARQLVVQALALRGKHSGVSLWREAERSDAFQKDLKWLYAALSEDERQALALVYLADKMRMKWEKARSLWEIRSDTTVPDEDSLGQKIEYLMNQRLLIMPKLEASYKIMCPAFERFIPKQDTTKEMSRLLGVETDKGHGREQFLLVSLILLAMIWYLLALFFRPWWLTLIRPLPMAIAGIADILIMFGGMLPLVVLAIYLVIVQFRKV